jgi:zinc transporter ZupT
VISRNHKKSLLDHYNTFKDESDANANKESIIVSTVGLVIHSMADGTALGVSNFCKDLLLFH